MEAFAGPCRRFAAAALTRLRSPRIVSELRRATQAAPSDLPMLAALTLNGYTADAISILGKFYESEQSLIGRLMGMLALALQGERSRALELVDPDLELWASKDFSYSLWLAEPLALMGEVERAMDYLDSPVERGNINYRFIGDYDAFLALLREVPRSRQIVDPCPQGPGELARQRQPGS
jgi:hypothetical protein